jgi:hypothetical protein
MRSQWFSIFVVVAGFLTGCATHSPVTHVAEPREVEEVWAALLQRMEVGDVEGVRRLTTDQGFRDLTKGSTKDNVSQQLSYFGKAVHSWTLRFYATRADVKQYHAGPEGREAGIEFVNGEAGWRLNRWIPGF